MVSSHAHACNTTDSFAISPTSAAVGLCFGATPSGIVNVINRFDPHPGLWLTSVGLSAIIGTALLISTRSSAQGTTSRSIAGRSCGFI